MIGDLFDSPFKILIVAVVILVLFGSAKLPAAARSLGKSMRILKTEIKDLHEDDDEAVPPAPAIMRQPATPPPLTAAQAKQQIEDLQVQLAGLRGPAEEPVAGPAPRQAG
jgi:sec-independent protein translocase protein TatA